MTYQLLPQPQLGESIVTSTQLVELEKLLQRDDWHYGYTDSRLVGHIDPSVYAAIKTLAKEIGESGISLWQTYHDKVYCSPHFTKSKVGS